MKPACTQMAALSFAALPAALGHLLPWVTVQGAQLPSSGPGPLRLSIWLLFLIL